MADLDAAIEAAARAYDAELNGRLGNPPGSVLGDVHDPGLARISAFRAAIAGAAPLIRADERAKVRAELLAIVERWRWTGGQYEAEDLRWVADRIAPEVNHG